MVDRYTKVVLTVIACALVALVAQNAVPGAYAQLDGPMHVQICDRLSCASLAPVMDYLTPQHPITTYGLQVVQPPEK